jgi:hypothetical protein
MVSSLCYPFHETGAVCYGAAEPACASASQPTGKSGPTRSCSPQISLLAMRQEVRRCGMSRIHIGRCQESSERRVRACSRNVTVTEPNACSHKVMQDDARDGVHFISVSRSGTVAPVAVPPLAGRAGPGPSAGPADGVANASAAPPFNTSKGGSSTVTQSAITTSAGALRPSQGAIPGASVAQAFDRANAGQATANSSAQMVRAASGASQQGDLGPARQKPKDALRAKWVHPTSATAHSAEIGKRVGMPTPPTRRQVPIGLGKSARFLCGAPMWKPCLNQCETSSIWNQHGRSMGAQWRGQSAPSLPPQPGSSLVSSSIPHARPICLQHDAALRNTSIMP